MERHDSKSVEGQCACDDFKSLEIVNVYDNKKIKKKKFGLLSRGRVFRTFEKTNKRLCSNTQTLCIQYTNIYYSTSIFV